MILQDSIISFKTKNTVNLRKEPSVNSKVLVILNKGESIIVSDSIGSWVSVIYPNKNLKGFINHKYVLRELVSSKKSEPKSKPTRNETLFIEFGLLIILLFFVFDLKKKISSLKKELFKYEPISDIHKEITEKNIQKNELNQEYAKGKEIFDELKEKIKVFNNEYELIENGIYMPIFNFGTSEEFKLKIIENKNTQKQLIRNKDACVCDVEWSVDGSIREGKKKTNRQIRLTLRAFNGECDSLTTKVSWNNINRLIERVQKTFEMINNLNEPNKTFLTDEFLKLKIEELKLNHEHKLKKYQEKDIEKEHRSVLREEEKARRDFEKAEKEAVQKEKIYEKALEEARKELGLASEGEVDQLEEKIKNLESELRTTMERVERVKSMAQQTKRGHVYVVSNIGSFGENIYKIGMTRRLDPMDRVKELGDASVPFRFDMHAMIYTDDAPKLESLLHKRFNHLRVNKVNNRKEYFNVSIEEIENCIKENFKNEFEITKESNAQEYQETLLLKTKELKNISDEKDFKFPDELF